MMSRYNDLRLIGIAWRLDHLRWAESSNLDNAVRSSGACMTASSAAEPPCGDRPMTDAALAALLCAGCPVMDECLELELRTAGEDTFGVWGGLPEEDRRELHFHWRRRGERALDHEEGSSAG